MNEKAGCITINCGCCGNGGTSGGSGAENVYSTEETVCGTWIDGKPIYRKVIIGKTETTSGINYVFANVTDLKIDRVINLYGNMVDNANGAHITLQTSFNLPNEIGAAVNMYYQKKTGKILYQFLNNNGAYSNCTAYAILEYTKETDSAE